MSAYKSTLFQLCCQLAPTSLSLILHSLRMHAPAPPNAHNKKRRSETRVVMEAVVGAGAMATGMYLRDRRRRKADEKTNMFPGMTLHPHKLTAGGQAKVYRGLRKGEKVAVKIFQNADDGLDELRIELEALYRMPPHPNVVSVVTYYERPKPALVTEFVEGMNLMDFYTNRDKKLSIRKGVEMALGLARGLKHMHEHGLVHRDIKSNNIMIDAKDGRPVIIDFGLASARPEADVLSREVAEGAGSVDVTVAVNPTVTANLKGTPCWLAPEMIVAKVWDERSDVYSFAIVVWEIFAGQLPFTDPRVGGVHDILKYVGKGGRPSMKAIRDTPQNVQDLIQACWEQDLRDRPSMRRVVASLDYILRNL